MTSSSNNGGRAKARADPKFVDLDEDDESDLPISDDDENEVVPSKRKATASSTVTSQPQTPPGAMLAPSKVAATAAHPLTGVPAAVNMTLLNGHGTIPFTITIPPAALENNDLNQKSLLAQRPASNGSVAAALSSAASNGANGGELSNATKISSSPRNLTPSSAGSSVSTSSNPFNLSISRAADSSVAIDEDYDA